MTYLVTKKVTQNYVVEVEANSEEEALEEAYGYGNDAWDLPAPGEFDEEYEVELQSHEKVGQYINVYDEGCTYDVFVLLCEANDPITPEQINEASKIVRKNLNDKDKMRMELEDLFPWGVEIR